MVLFIQITKIKFGFVTKITDNFRTDAEELKTSSEESKANETIVEASDSSANIFSQGDYLGQDVYLSVYGSMIVAVLIFTMTRAVAFFSYCLRISNNLHNDMFSAVVQTPVKFYSDNPSGRIMNRFTKDMGSIDELLPPALFDSLDYFLQMMGVIFVIITSNFYLAIPTVALVFIFWILRTVFVQTSRDVKRLESICKVKY
jgi:ATP-binding cassette subfamily C (CFTR/MRP) protein 4